jgi:hypothetical protein
MAPLLLDALLYVILPLWLLAGFTDYVLHKRTQIERTAGTRESLLHLLQLSEIGLPVLLGLLFEINSVVLAFMLLAFTVHEATALYDVSYALHRRDVGVLEQHVHSFMEVLPFVALLFVTILNWDQFLVLFGLGSAPPRFELKLKTDPIPAGYLLTLLSSILFFIIVPYAEELWRCMKVERHRLVKPNIAQAA